MPLTSCSSDDDNGGQDPIIGKWKMVKSITEHFEGENKTSENEKDLNEYYEEFEFKNDNSVVNTEYYPSSEDPQDKDVFHGTYVMEGNELVITYKYENEDDDVYEYTYSVSGNKLILVSSQEYGEQKKDVSTDTFEKQ